MNMPAIMYHDVIDRDFDESGWSGSAAARYKLRRADFEEHLKALAGDGVWNAVLVTSDPGLQAHAFYFTVDDGGACSIYIADRLEARGWRGHFFITTNQIGKPGFASRRAIRELHDRGHGIGSHSASHPDWMSELPDEELSDEWQQSARVLAEILGEPVIIGSVPGGFYAPRVAKAALASGIRILFTSEPTMAISVVDGCRVLGRFAVRRGDLPAKAAALIWGQGPSRIQQSLAWTMKGLVKRHARPLWNGVRRAMDVRQGI